MTTLENKSSGVFSFEIDSDDSITYATAFNGKSIIRSLIIRSLDQSVITNVLVEVEMSSLGKKISETWKLEIGTLAKSAINIENLSLEFYSELLFQQSQPVPAELTVRISSEESVLTEVKWSLTLHSPDTWLWSESSNEVVAAFVQPNSPVLRAVLDDAVEILRKSGQNVILSGYQLPSHVRPMVSAIYQALVNRDITYSNPPASWDLPGGQRIRSAQKILDEKVGTCLDTAVLFASLLEACGIYPVIAIIPGHAFVGYWTAEYFSEQPQFPRWTEMPIVDVMNAVDSGYIELFETTTICKGPTQVPYQTAIKESAARISVTGGLGINASQSTLINISACRMLRPRAITPMPVAFQTSDGTVQRINYQPIEFSVGMLKDQLSAEGAGGQAAGAIGLNVPPVIKRWLDSLLDLSARNPLINFKEPRSCVPLLSAPKLLGVIENLLQNRQTLTLISSNAQLDDRGNVAGNREAEGQLAQMLSQMTLLTKFSEDAHKANLRKMTSSAKTFFEETGSNGLYLALGSLNWTTKEGRKVRSPLILVPVNLISKNRGKEFFISIDEGSQVMPNFSLAEKLLRDEGIKLDNLVNLVEDESGVDIDGTFEYMRKTLANAGIMDFRIDENAVLGFFNFSTYRLWRDLLDNWKIFAENPLVKHFINTPNQDFKDPVQEPINNDLDDLASRLPISSDSSQARAIAHAMAGRTFILQGPPGTGKSQTITNLLARALSEGKRILFVAEKKDALDVVKNRLDAIGLGVFSLDLHDKGMNPKVVKEQLSNVIDIEIQTDRVGYENARGEHDNAILPLKKYRIRLHEVGKLGESIYSAIDKKLALNSEVALDIPGKFIAEAEIITKDELVKATKSLADMGPQTGSASANPWSLATRSSELSEIEVQALKSLIARLLESTKTFSANPALLNFVESLETLDQIKALRVLQYIEAKLNYGSGLNSANFQQIVNKAEESLDKFRKSVVDFGIELIDLDQINLDEWLSKSRNADASFVLFRSLNQNKLLKKFIKDLNLDISIDRQVLSAKITELIKIKNLKNLAVSDLEKITNLRVEQVNNFYSTQTVDFYSQSLENVREYRSMIELFTNDISRFVDSCKVNELEQLAEFSTEFSQLSELLAVDDISAALWQGRSKFGEKVLQGISLWSSDAIEHSFSQLNRWIVLMECAKPFKKYQLLEPLNEILSGRVNFIDAPRAFLKGYYEALIKNLLVDRGFNAFEAMVINNHIKNFKESNDGIRSQLPRITGSELLSKRGFDSSMKVGAVGDLNAVLKQPRNKYPIRTLLSKHWGIITKITPCVLASPDSCVRFIDPNLPPFDLVVFDEASQIRVANSIGAIGRAKSVVIVGDSKQMPPTSVAQVKVSENDNDEEEDYESGLLSFDMESILDHCENARVPDIMLNWHYRSEDESLIAFSNKKYYDGKLNSFPSPSSDRSMKGLSFEYVENGQFVRPENSKESVKGVKGTNKAEIDAILAHLSKRLKDPLTKNDSIGIVTFNKPQMDEIMKSLIDSPDPVIQQALLEGVGGEEIFVKNLESVQGSERDVILFSVAFSKNLKGELPLNFGPLNNAGGERRLNVAITRARKQVRIFCSFKPDELTNRKTSSTGVNHLAQFLKMANKQEDDDFDVYTIRESHPDRVRKQILDKLLATGLDAKEEVGLSDFKVDIAIYDPKDKTRAVLGILLDGPRWNSRETVSDRDCLSVDLLKGKMGWNAIERIWLASWLRDPQGEVERISKAFNEALTSIKTPAKPAERKVKVEPIHTLKNSDHSSPTESTFVNLFNDVETWSALEPSIIGTKEHLDYLYDTNVIDAIEKIASQLTNVEGPVSAERFAKFIGACFGLNRVVANRVDSINSLRLPGFQRDEEGFIFPKGETYFTFKIWRKGTENEGRNLGAISLSEISNCMRDVAFAGQGVRKDQLYKEASRLLGIAKVSATSNDRLDAALKFAIANGRLINSGEYLQAVNI